MFGKKIFVMVMNIGVHEKYGYNACINLIIITLLWYAIFLNHANSVGGSQYTFSTLWSM